MGSAGDGRPGHIPLLPTTTKNAGSVQSPEEKLQDTKPPVGSWEAKYKAADSRLFALEEELDYLLYWSKQLREQRLKLVQSGIQHADSFPYERTMPSSEVDANQLADQCLTPFKKGQDIGDAVEKVKNDCRLARTECCSLFLKARSPSTSAPNQPGSNEDSEEDMLGHGRTTLADLMHRDIWGAMDSNFSGQRFLEMRTRVREISVVIGVLGAGSTYSTLLSANRGRLDLVSWAFTAFVLLLVHGVLLQALEGPKSFGIFALENSTLVSRRNQILLHDIPLIMLMILGTVLVVLSVALCDPTAPPVPGSKVSLRVAVYIPLLAFGYAIIIAIAYITKAERGWPKGSKSPRGFPSHLVPRDERWRLLPGGDEYGMYRKQRIGKSDSVP